MLSAATATAYVLLRQPGLPTVLCEADQLLSGEYEKGKTVTSHSVSIGAGNMELSGRYFRATNGQPRVLLVALHGGTYTSKYFDTSPSLLLEFCASLGYSILALDRPGYGAATSVPLDQLSFDGQVPILRQALEEIWDEYGQQSVGMFLIGHSIGGMLSLLLAAENPHERLLGLNMTGSGSLNHAQTETAFANGTRDLVQKGIEVFRWNMG